MTLLEIAELSVWTKDGIPLVEPISLRLQAGQNITILGETGSGKSLLIQAIMGALPQDLLASGTVLLEGRPLTVPQRIWGKTLMMLPQEPRRSLDPIMNVEQQLWESFHFVAQQPAATALKSSTATLTTLGLAHAKHAYPHQLSGGMAQRAAFAIATATGGKILLADEPTKGLDTHNKYAVIDLLKQAYQQQGALLTITHDIEVAECLGGEILVMQKGQKLEHAKAETVLHTPTHPYTQALIVADPRNWPKSTPKSCSEKLLSVRNLSLTRGKKTLFEKLSFELAQGEILGIVGKSGIGKSSLADALCGFIQPSFGEICWHKKHARHQVLKLYQDPPEAFAPNISLQTLLNDVIQKHKLDSRQIPFLLTQLGLSEDILSRCAENVSGGELQRIAILRALLLQPILLFADEVTSRLDPITQQETIKLLLTQCRSRSCGLILVSHDRHLIENSCDQVINLEEFTVTSY